MQKISLNEFVKNRLDKIDLVVLIICIEKNSNPYKVLESEQHF